MLLNVGRMATLCAALTVLIFSAGPAFADPIDNGTDNQFSDTTGDPYYDPLLNPTSSPVADQIAPFSFGAETGTVESSVWSGSSNNPYDANYIGGAGPTTGALTFVYQITLTSTGGDIAQIGAADFSTYMTDVGYYDQTGSQVWPTFVSRDLDGSGVSTVSFQFLDLGGNYSTVNGTSPTDQDDQPVPNYGEPSALLVVNTDATTYSPSIVTLQDDSNGSTTSYSVNSYSNIMTPEPASIVMMVLGMTGLLAVARARRSGRQA